MASRYLVFRAGAQTGLGHNLMSIVSYAHLCHELQRTLVLDLREFKYLIDPQINFTRHFAFEGKDWPAVEMDPEFIDRLYASPNRLDCVYEEDLIESLRYEGDLASGDSNVLIIPSRFFGWNPSWGKKAIRLGLRGNLSNQFDRIRSEYFSDKPVIGIHFRHGNGEYLDGRISPESPAYEDCYLKLLDAYTEKVRQIEKSSSCGCAVFVCSDNLEFREDMKRRLSGAFSVTSHIPPTPHLLLNAENGLAECIDAIFDLWCLGECDFLIGSGSAFSDFAFFNSRKLNPERRFSVRVNHLLNSIPDCTEAGLIRDTLLVRLFLRNAPVTFHAYRQILELAGESSKATNAAKRAEYLRYYEHKDWRESISLLAAADLDDAVSSMADVAESGHNPFIWSHLSDLLFIAGRHKEAVSAIEMAIELDPGWPWFHSIQSKIFNVMSMREQSIRAAESAVCCTPHSALLQGRLLYLRLTPQEQSRNDSQELNELVASGKLGMSFTKEPGFFRLD